MEELNSRGGSQHNRLKSLTKTTVGGVGTPSNINAGISDYPVSTISRGSTVGGGEY